MTTTAAPDTTTYLIERPRLLAELDAAEARGVRAICLVAPAGYGKTVLAEQWVRSRHPDAIWHYARPNVTDLTYVIDDLAESLDRVMGGADEKIRALRGRRASLVEGDLLREFVDVVRRGPREPWLVLDDAESLFANACGALITDLLRTRAARLLLTCRTRPGIASPRAILYQEVAVLAAEELAFTEEEVASIPTSTRMNATELVHETGGWPVLVTLRLCQPPSDATSAPVGDFSGFVRHDVVRQLPADVMEGLVALSLVHAPSRTSAERLLGLDTSRVLELASQRGLVTHTREGIVGVHPLIRAVLRAHLKQLPSARQRSLVRRAFASALRARDPDGAIAIAVDTESTDLALRAIRHSYRCALGAGRITAVRRWIEQIPVNNALHRLVTAEIDLLDGILDRAESLATLAADSAIDARDRVRARCTAGLAALLSARAAEARVHYEQALSEARSSTERSNALWGVFTAASAAEDPDAAQTLENYRRCGRDSPEKTLRYVTARLQLQTPAETIQATLAEARRARHAALLVADARIRAAFYAMLADHLLEAGCLREFEEAVEQLRVEISECGVAFAAPLVNLLTARRATIERRFHHAQLLLSQPGQRDDAPLVEAQGAEFVSLFLTLSREGPQAVLDAYARTSRTHSFASVQLVTSPALAICAAAVGDEVAFERYTAQTREQSRVDVAHLSSFAHAIHTLSSGLDGERCALEALAATAETTDCTSLVMAYRAYPPLLASLARSSGPSRAHLNRTLEIAQDWELARRAGLEVPTAGVATTTLSARENEVLALLAEGFTNREIAKSLFIAEATAKLHVRRILAKTGCRSRTEAAIHARG
jgi:ATP/maltotriose-dependent transcriptional regulator MalT